MAIDAYGYAVATETVVRRTQKARSVEALKMAGFSVPPFSIHPIEKFVRTDTLFPIPTNDIHSLVGKFVRPCPVTPRHGFVDSRPVLTTEDAEKLVLETMNAESQAELIAMPFIDSAFSAIYTPGQLVIGKGNAGATEGKDSRSIPVIGYPCTTDYQWEKAKKLAGITESPYVEMLWESTGNDANVYGDGAYNKLFVQLRNGPELPGTGDYIPEEIVVKKIEMAGGDLLEWETKVKLFEKGTVVYHPGGSLASHYAVHAVLNRIPVLISRQPKIGETLRAETVVSTPDINKIQAGFVYACKADISQVAAGLAMLVGCHSTAVWLGKMDGLLGFAMGCAYRLAVIASLGEFRHKARRVDFKSNSKVLARETVYTRAWGKVLTQATRTRFVKSMESFKNDKWDGSFGGKKWYAFAALAGSVYNKLVDRDAKGALEQLNQLIHAEHNGGWAFNKFLVQSSFDECAANPCVTLLKVAPQIYTTIVALESKAGLETFFEGKHHFDVDLDLAAAQQEEARDRARGERPDNSYNDFICGVCGKGDCCKSCHSGNCKGAKKGKGHSDSGIEVYVQPTQDKFSNGEDTVYVSIKKNGVTQDGKWIKLNSEYVKAIDNTFKTKITHPFSPIVQTGWVSEYIKAKPSRVISNKYWIWIPTVTEPIAIVV
jgi:hypothetical protein